MDNYHVIDLIGEGSFGKVRAARGRRGVKLALLVNTLLAHLASRCTKGAGNALGRSPR